MRDIPAILILVIYLIYVVIRPEITILWIVIFLIGLLYAIFTIRHWIEHESFNIYISLGLLTFSLLLFGLTFVSYLLETILTVELLGVF